MSVSNDLITHSSLDEQSPATSRTLKLSFDTINLVACISLVRRHSKRGGDQ